MTNPEDPVINQPDSSSRPEGLDEFSKKNPHCEITKTPTGILIKKPFGYEDSQLHFDDPILPEIVSDLNNITLRPQFDAIFHDDSRLVEFLGGFVNPASKNTGGYLDRKFTTIFRNVECSCFFQEASPRAFRISQGMQRTNASTDVRAGYQLFQLRDGQKPERLSPRNSAFFEGKVSRSFFVDISQLDLAESDFEDFAHNLNFLMRYYDRHSAQIVIRDKQLPDASPHAVGVRYIGNKFPQIVSVREYNEVALRLLEVAEESRPRVAFLYYYQIFEYAGFHYIDAKAKNGMIKILRDPAILDNLAERIGELFAALADTAHNDDARMQKLIDDTCDPRIIWREIEPHRGFFSADVDFVGGFKCPPLISKDLTVDGWTQMWTPKLFTQLTKIRNNLVHAREKRESKGILPDKGNDVRIGYYTLIIRRMAEMVVFACDSF